MATGYLTISWLFSYDAVFQWLLFNHASLTKLIYHGLIITLFSLMIRSTDSEWVLAVPVRKIAQFPSDSNPEFLCEGIRGDSRVDSAHSNKARYKDRAGTAESLLWSLYFCVSRNLRFRHLRADPNILNSTHKFIHFILKLIFWPTRWWFKCIVIWHSAKIPIRHFIPSFPSSPFPSFIHNFIFIILNCVLFRSHQPELFIMSLFWLRINNYIFVSTIGLQGTSVTIKQKWLKI